MNNRFPIGARVRVLVSNNEFRRGTITAVINDPLHKGLQIVFDGEDNYPYTYGDWDGPWSITSVLSDVLKDTLETTTTPEVTHDHP